MWGGWGRNDSGALDQQAMDINEDPEGFYPGAGGEVRVCAEWGGKEGGGDANFQLSSFQCGRDQVA